MVAPVSHPDPDPDAPAQEAAPEAAQTVAAETGPASTAAPEAPAAAPPPPDREAPGVPAVFEPVPDLTLSVQATLPPPLPQARSVTPPADVLAQELPPSLIPPTTPAPDQEPPAELAPLEEGEDPVDPSDLVPQDPPAPGLTLPTPNPERSQRRVRAGRFMGGIMLPTAVALAAPPVILVAMHWPVLWETQDTTAVAALPAAMQEDGAVLSQAVAEARRQMAKADGPAAVMAKTECKRAAFRGAMLVDQEVARLRLEARHAVALEAALTRNPALAQKEKPVALAPAQIEPFLQRAGLTTPAGASEGEVVLDQTGAGIGGPLPVAFMELLAAASEASDGTATVDGRVAWRAPVKDTPWFVVAVRTLPPVANPSSLDTALQAARRLEDASKVVGPALGSATARTQAQQQRMVRTALLLALAGVLGTLLVLARLRTRVVAPLRELRAQLERVRAGLRPQTPTHQDALADLHTALAGVAEQLADAQALGGAVAERNRTLEEVMEVCRRAERGDLTARPSLSSGPEGLTALAVTHLLESVERHAARIRTQSRAVLDGLSAAEQMRAPTLEAPAIREPLDLLKQRLDALAPLPNLLRNLASRMTQLAGQRELAVVVEDLQRLSAALAPRAQAAAALLADVVAQHGRLLQALGEARSRSVDEALTRARQAAQDLVKDARAQRGDNSIPTVLAGLAGLPPAELQRAWRAEDPPLA